jgi:hypothetical protein
MDAASAQLVATAYFDTVRLCARAAELCVKAREWERLSRIAMPLLEARRQIRQIAVDAGTVRVIDTPEALRAPAERGCVLVVPPLIGADARAYRLAAEQRQTPVVVLAREPMTNADLWPIVGVSILTVRTRIPPPPGVERSGAGVTRDTLREPVALDWFEAAAEALGDAAIASVDPKAPAAHRVEDLLERIDAVPEHEKLHQALAAAAQRAALEPAPSFPRRRGPDHPYSF